MLPTLIKYLNSYEPLVNLIGPNRLFPIMATDLSNPALEYTYKYVMGGIIKQSQFSINIVWNNYDDILKIEESLLSALDMELSDQFITMGQVQFNSRVTGGSVPMYRADMKLYMVNINFIIKWRKVTNDN